MMEFRSYGDAYNFLLEKFQERGFLTDVNLTDSNDFVSVGDMSTLRNALGEIWRIALLSCPIECLFAFG